MCSISPLLSPVSEVPWILIEGCTRALLRRFFGILKISAAFFFPLHFHCLDTKKILAHRHIRSPESFFFLLKQYLSFVSAFDFFLLFYFSLSAALSGTDAAPRGVWIVFCYISEICSRSASSQPSLPTESSRPLLLRSAALWFRPSIITRKNSSGCLMNPRQKHSRITSRRFFFQLLPSLFFFFSPLHPLSLSSP